MLVYVEETLPSMLIPWIASTHTVFTPHAREAVRYGVRLSREPVISHVYIEKRPPSNCPSLRYQASTEPQRDSLVNTPLNFIVP